MIFAQEEKHLRNSCSKTCWNAEDSKPLDSYGLERFKWKLNVSEEVSFGFHITPVILNCLPCLNSITLRPRFPFKFILKKEWLNGPLICCSPCRFCLICSDVWNMHSINCLKRMESVGLPQCVWKQEEKMWTWTQQKVREGYLCVSAVYDGFVCISFGFNM